jgi:hypothetical protein
MSIAPAGLSTGRRPTSVLKAAILEKEGQVRLDANPDLEDARVGEEEA